MINDEFKTIKTKGTSIYKEKGSKFYGFAIPVFSTEDVKIELKKLHSEFHNSRHVCYAYRINPLNTIERANDDGEPSNTAGAPILNQIYSTETFNILVAVVRYFGGVKLGVPGLIRSYKTAATEAILDSGVVTSILKTRVKLIADYNNVNEMMRLIKRFNLKIIEQKSTDRMTVIVEIRRNDYETIERIVCQQNLFTFEPLQVHN